MKAVLFMSDHYCRKTYRGNHSIPRALKLTGPLYDFFLSFYFFLQIFDDANNAISLLSSGTVFTTQEGQ
jgi:hypothetical protein